MLCPDLHLIYTRHYRHILHADQYPRVKCVYRNISQKYIYHSAADIHYHHEQNYCGKWLEIAFSWFTCRHLYTDQRVDEHKTTIVGRHAKEMHGDRGFG